MVFAGCRVGFFLFFLVMWVLIFNPIVTFLATRLIVHKTRALSYKFYYRINDALSPVELAIQAWTFQLRRGSAAPSFSVTI